MRGLDLTAVFQLADGLETLGRGFYPEQTQIPEHGKMLSMAEKLGELVFSKSFHRVKEFLINQPEFAK